MVKKKKRLNNIEYIKMLYIFKKNFLNSKIENFKIKKIIPEKY